MTDSDWNESGPSAPRLPRITAAEWRQLSPLLDAALELPAPLRRQYVDDVASRDTRLGRELRALLAHDGDEDLLTTAANDRSSLLADENRSATDALRQGLGKHLGEQYTLEAELGGGSGVARVFVAHEARLDRRVVIKVLPPAVSAHISGERFEQEIRLSASLQHANIVPVLSAGHGSYGSFYVMPYIQGSSLQERLDLDTPLSLLEATNILRDVVRALVYAHGRGVVHRDIKPGNILLSGGAAVVIDFGIATAVAAATDAPPSDPAPARTTVLGTPRYMAPEQALGLPLDHRADIYSLGVVAYEMLMGVPPFDARGMRDAMTAHVASRPIPIHERRPDLAPELATLVMRCLEKRPDGRPQTAAELCAAIDTIDRKPVTRAIAYRKRALVGMLATTLVAAGGVWAATSRASSETARIVVVPFRTTGDSARAYFAAGMTNALRMRLASVPDIDVIADAVPADSAPPAVVARRLGAGYALTGTVAWDSTDGGQLQVQPRLVSARDDRVVLEWPSPITVPVRAGLEAERTITEKIAAAMSVTLGAALRARLAKRFGDDPAAYAALLRASVSTNDLIRRELLLRAVAIDSNLAPAWAELARLDAAHYLTRTDSADVIAARRESARALALAPDLAEAHFAAGLYHRSVTHDYDSSIYHFRIAKNLLPGDADVSNFLASAYFSAGHFAEALTEARRAAGLDPSNPSAITRVERLQLWMKEPNAAWDTYAPILRLNPATLGPMHWADGAIVRLAQGNLRQARAQIASTPPEQRGTAVGFLIVNMLFPQLIDDTLAARICADRTADSFPEAGWGRNLLCAESARRSGRKREVRAEADSAIVELRAGVRRNPDDFSKRVHLGWALALHGDSIDAVAAADTSCTIRSRTNDAFFGTWNSFDCAQVYSMAHDANRAVPALDALVATPSPITKAWLRVDPTFDGIRPDARFSDLTRGAEAP